MRKTAVNISFWHKGKHMNLNEINQTPPLGWRVQKNQLHQMINFIDDLIKPTREPCVEIPAACPPHQS
jgi:hypothetical protein